MATIIPFHGRAPTNNLQTQNHNLTHVRNKTQNNDQVQSQEKAHQNIQNRIKSLAPDENGLTKNPIAATVNNTISQLGRIPGGLHKVQLKL